MTHCGVACIVDQMSVVSLDYLTVQEAASSLGLSLSTLWRWNRKGNLKAEKYPTNDSRLYLPKQSDGEHDPQS